MLTVRETVAAHSFCDALKENFNAFVDADDKLHSPFFRFEFLEALAFVRSDLRIAVLQHDSQIAGFFPYHVGFFGAAEPAGGVVSDYHGVIAAPGATWDATELIKRLGLSSLSFHSLLATQQSFLPYTRRSNPSWIIDLSSGYLAYRSSNRAKSNWIEQSERKMRKLEREKGNVKFVAQMLDISALDTLIAWKTDQYIRTDAQRLFDKGWVVSFLQRLYGTNSDGFAGLLSGLYAGERLIALHFGIRSRSTWHYWFPVYDLSYSGYSPGSILLLRMIEHACQSGITRIDLGKGSERYKLSAQNDSVSVGEGAIYRPTPFGLSRRAIDELETAVRRTTVLRGPLRWTYKKCRTALSGTGSFFARRG